MLRLIQHPKFQRLRRISQTGLLSLVYPGATHTRFQHALGAMHLMRVALETLQIKGIVVTPEEKTAAQAAILLHDIGHGPFSHALENVVLEGFHHEELSLLIMKDINDELGGALDISIKIFTGDYPKTFLHELVSSQLDMDRMDYLKRDSFFTGVVEGNVNADRIIAMLNVSENHLVIEEKGIISVEHFLSARLLMYWQVYFHKTAITAEYLLVQLFKRIKILYLEGDRSLFFGTLQALQDTDFSKNKSLFLQLFSKLDDTDMYLHIKNWCDSKDEIIRFLSNALIYRNLPKTKVYYEPVSDEIFHSKLAEAYQMASKPIVDICVTRHYKSLSAYDINAKHILIYKKSGKIIPWTSYHGGVMTLSLLNKTEKYYLSFLDSLGGKIA